MVGGEQYLQSQISTKSCPSGSLHLFSVGRFLRGVKNLENSFKWERSLFYFLTLKMEGVISLACDVEFVRIYAMTSIKDSDVW